MFLCLRSLPRLCILENAFTTLNKSQYITLRHILHSLRCIILGITLPVCCQFFIGTHTEESIFYEDFHGFGEEKATALVNYSFPNPNIRCAVIERTAYLIFNRWCLHLTPYRRMFSHFCETDSFLVRSFDCVCASGQRDCLSNASWCAMRQLLVQCSACAHVPYQHQEMQV